jgi:glutaconate CoA-transferase subunit B
MTGGGGTGAGGQTGTSSGAGGAGGRGMTSQGGSGRGPITGTPAKRGSNTGGAHGGPADGQSHDGAHATGHDGTDPHYTADEMMTVAAARALRDGAVCFVGIGLPSTAANLARRTHAPELVLVYESGTLGAKPDRLPLSIGDGILADTADAVISVPEVFNYWLQPGRIDIGFLGAAQLDRYANVNTTVIGDDYRSPKVRLPGAGGAPEIAASCREVIVVVRQSTRTFVDRVDFVTSVGFGRGRGDRERLGLTGGGPRIVITDLGVLRPDPDTCELVLTAVHPGVDIDEVRARTGWDLRVADPLQQTDPPTHAELAALRRLNQADQQE